MITIEHEMSLKGTSALTLIIVLSTLLLGMSAVGGQTNETSVKFYLQIYEVSLATDTAQVNLTVTLINLNTTGLALTEPVRAVITDDIDNMEITCNRNYEGYFIGSSGLITWSLGGEMGKGEYFPFENYELKFKLANVLPLLPNMSTVKALSSDSFAYIVGSKKVILAQSFKTENTNAGLLVENYIPQDSLNFTAILSRKVSDSLIWLLVAPTIASYCLLFATLLIVGPKALTNRLAAYVSIFVFASTFLMAIQGYLPLRTSLSIPEVLLENLMIGTIIFAVVSLIKVRSNVEEIARDGSIVFLSLFSFSYIVNHFMPLFPGAAMPVFLWAFAPIVVAVFLIWFSKCLEGTGKPSRDVQLFVSVSVGTGVLAFGFFLLAYYLGAYFALYDTSFAYIAMIGIPFVVMGSVLILLWRRLKRTRAPVVRYVV